MPRRPVAIDLTRLRWGYVGGVESYVRGLLGGFRKIGVHHNIEVIVNSPGDKWLTRHYGVRLRVLRRQRRGDPIYRTVNLGAKWVPRMYRLRDYLYGKARQLERYYRAVHYPLTVIDPAMDAAHIPLVVTMHDIQQEHFPEYFAPDVLHARRTHYRRSAAKAAVILCDSEFVRRDIHECYGVALDKLVTIYPGIDETFVPVRDGALLRSISDRYRLPGGYVFYPATPWAHKNHARLLHALARLPGVHLVLTASSRGLYRQAELMAIGAELGLASRVHWLGHVPLAHMPALYSMAAALVFPSEFEGFGFPILEAMAVGCPVACANVTSLPEIGGDAVVYFDPRSVEEIVEATRAILSNEQLRRSLIARGFARAKLFSWQVAARRTFAVYERLG